ncbi:MULTISPECIES: ABC transporter ATP-binding protein [unclassified Chryseobacterium]|uniref:ABC transporter ATP-binding protein n=1 Tax=unclassified Chryseobacterium TaxID=2593645 RepID=UPI000D3C60F7|nr:MULTISPECIES: ABC transporter ATP-binding protein [unclassified Chryseobacterium]PTT72601.1 hypothetical protein DBR25_14360 [Chryseobacterium sp. HMWF001]PVV50422.1 ABC transporter ATP-binding protein [Chryseobacterium sp. HMWF035]
MKVENVQFGYDKSHPIINNVSFTMNGQYYLAVVGASGCGKSTLLRLISGNLPSDKNLFYQGRILIDGLCPEENVKKGTTGFMFQDPALFPNRNVWDNINLPLTLRKKSDKEWVDHLIEKVGLTAYKNYLPSQLSGGMKTRVALARTFVTRPQLILLDEPFGALDVKWKSILYKELETLRGEVSARVIIVTHDIQEALLLSNKILVMSKDGRIAEDILIEYPLPRVFGDEDVFGLEREYKKIKKLIIED